ncbi:MAG TPA: TadE family protein [Candidatus Binataceae bacterium]|nr:TadE family protein [Candidatus Binataceae bacterium]
MRRWPNNAARGQGVLEAALIAPILMFILLVVVEAGRMMYLSVALEHAADAAAEYGATTTTDADVSGMQSAATSDVQASGLFAKLYPANAFAATASNFCQCADGAATSCANNTCSSGAFAVFVQVKTSATYSTLVNYPGLPSAFTMNAQATLRVQ